MVEEGEGVLGARKEDLCLTLCSLSFDLNALLIKVEKSWW